MEKNRDKSDYLVTRCEQIKAHCKIEAEGTHIVPLIKLKGGWLRKLGFVESNYCYVYGNEDCIVLKPG